MSWAWVRTATYFTATVYRSSGQAKCTGQEEGEQQGLGNVLLFSLPFWATGISQALALEPVPAR